MFFWEVFSSQALCARLVTIRHYRPFPHCAVLAVFTPLNRPFCRSMQGLLSGICRNGVSTDFITMKPHSLSQPCTLCPSASLSQ